MIVEREYYVKLSEIGKENKITNKALLGILEDIGGVHSNIAGYGIKTMDQTRLTWILIDWKVQVIRRPEYAEKIFLYRKEFIEKIKEKILDIHKKITQNNEIIKIEYISDCENKEKYLKKLKNEREKDIQRGYTGVGIHRDDFNVYINDKPLNIYGSQGQHRTVLLSMKISELNIIYDEIGEYPILLLDDFMSELDSNRRANLLANIENIQVIITCTDKMSLKDREKKIFYVKNGNIKLLEE